MDRRHKPGVNPFQGEEWNEFGGSLCQRHKINQKELGKETSGKNLVVDCVIGTR